jgi:steroid 5-alpha reductase family enzyme
MMNNYLSLFLLCAEALFIFQSLLFIIALLKRNNGIADIGWGIGFIIIVIAASGIYYLQYAFSNVFSDHFTPDLSFALIVSLVVLWGLRLSIYLIIRNWTKPEDWRYAKWRQDWGRNFYLRSFLQVFILQGFFMLVIGSPIILSAVDSATDAAPYSSLQYILTILGLLFWLIGFFFQAVGDAQLYSFKKAPAHKGRIMRYGVWRYTRHPNYFGEATMWWGIFLISCVSAHGPVGVLLRMIGPATITFMLLRVSGVTMLENKYKGNVEYENYQKNTSSFIPMMPKTQ